MIKSIGQVGVGGMGLSFPGMARGIPGFGGFADNFGNQLGGMGLQNLGLGGLGQQGLGQGLGGLGGLGSGSGGTGPGGFYQQPQTDFGSQGGFGQTSGFGPVGGGSQVGGGGTLGGFGGVGTGLGGLDTSSLQQQQPGRGPPGANLFIYNVPETFTDFDLQSMFSNFGNVVSGNIFRDKNTGFSRGFGFISYDNPVSAEKAIMALNGFHVGSKRLKVQLKTDGRGGGTGGGGGGLGGTSYQGRGYAPY